MADDDNMFCLWEEREYSDEGPSTLTCRYPLGNHFCDYVVEGENEQDKCPLYKPTRESSWIEEEVRQYLEYTEGGK